MRPVASSRARSWTAPAARRNSTASSLRSGVGKPMQPERAAAWLLAATMAFAVAGPAAAWGKPKAPAELSASGRADVMLAQNYLDNGQVAQAEDRAKSALLSDPGSQLT